MRLGVWPPSGSSSAWQDSGYEDGHSCTRLAPGLDDIKDWDNPRLLFVAKLQLHRDQSRDEDDRVELAHEGFEVAQRPGDRVDGRKIAISRRGQSDEAEENQFRLERSRHGRNGRLEGVRVVQEDERIRQGP